MLASVKPRTIRAPRGTTLSARSWMTEAPLRMLMNNLDPEVAENPDDLVVYGGIGRAARDWNCYDKIVETLEAADRGGDPARAIRQAGGRVPDPSRCAPRADRQLQSRAALGHLGALPRARPQGARHVRADDRRLVDLHRQPGHRAGHLRDLRRDGQARSCGPGRRQVDLHGRPRRHGRRAAARGHHGGLQHAGGRMPRKPHRHAAQDRLSRRAGRDAGRGARDDRGGEAQSQADLGRACSAMSSTCSPQMLERGIRPDALTDQTSAHDPVNGYLPQGWTRGAMGRAPRAAIRRARAPPRRRSMAKHVEYLLRYKAMGLPVFDYGNNLRQVAKDAGVARAFDIPGFVPEYVRPLFCRGIGPFRWAALSGDPEDIYKTDAKVRELIPGRSAPASLAGHGAIANPVPGLAGAHLLGGARPAPPPGTRLQ